MATKQKNYTYAEIDDKIKNFKVVTDGKPKDIIAPVNVFCKLQDIPAIKSDDVEPLLDACIAKMGGSYWKFLLEVFSRLFYKYSPLRNTKKSKSVNAILFSLLKVIENKFGDALDKNRLNKAIAENDSAQIKIIASELEGIVSLEKDEFLALLYMLFMLYGNKLLLQNREYGLMDIEKYFLELYHIPDPKDKLLVKRVVSALKGTEVRMNFYHLVGLYKNTSVEISQLEEKIVKQEKVIGDQKNKISLQGDEIFALRDKEQKLIDNIRDKQRQICELENDLKAGKDQNEFNENLYQKQYETLKKAFIKDLKKKLSLELQGLEDLADSLPEDKKIKIQRRIDNIHKILLKEEN